MRRQATVVGRHRRPTAGPLQLRLRAAGALLLAGSAGIHLYLYLTGYRSIPTIGWLFLLQVIFGFVLAAAVLATHSRLAVAASAALALSTLGAYLLAVWIGLFGFKEVRTRAGIAAGLIEVAAFATLAMAVIAAGPVREEGVSVSSGVRMVARVRMAVSTVIGAVGVVSVLALALLGVARIGGVTVLTNARGLTLYWFAPDTSTTSRCTGSCTDYWPPLIGNPEVGPGVTGRLGTVRRSGRVLQATYDGHPLYTYNGDNGPGSANGNNLDLNGGLWYEVRA
jgi:predicted lipoprotein with Yx(FWY)xxD motif